MSDTNRTALAFIAETTLGESPTTPYKRLRFTKEALEYEKQTVRSEEIREDRQMSEAVLVGFGTKGTVDTELNIGDFDAFFEAALANDFSGNTLINGTELKSFTIEKKITLEDETSSFTTFRGCTVNQLTLNLTAKQIVTAQFDFLGIGAREGAASYSGAAYDAAGTGELLSASANVANVKVDGAAVTAVKNLTLTIQSNNRAKDVIGQLAADDIGMGAFSVTGKMDAYFNDRTLLGKFLDHSKVGIQFDLIREPAGATVGTHIGYRFTVPSVRLTKASPNIGGQNQDVMLPIEIAAEGGNVGAKATGYVGGSTIADGSTLSIGGQLYTFKNTLTGAAYEVKAGVGDETAMLNLKAAINGEAGEGTKYGTGTAKNTKAAGIEVSSVASYFDLSLEALESGTEGNSIALTGSTFIHVSGATMSGGTDVAGTIKIEKLLKA